MKKIINLITLCAILLTSVTFEPQKAEAAASSKIIKMCKGKWDRASQDGINTHYCIFTSKYIKWYLNGKFDYKTKIVKVVKKSSKKYVFKVKNDPMGNKFRYVGHVKNGKFEGFDFYDGWSGTNGYSGSSSLYKI